jgi:hypothetical protein
VNRKKIKAGPAKQGVAGKHLRLAQEIKSIQRRAAAYDARFVTVGPLVFFSTETGDAWMLDPSDQLAEVAFQTPAQKFILKYFHGLHRFKIYAVPAMLFHANKYIFRLADVEQLCVCVIKTTLDLFGIIEKRHIAQHLSARVSGWCRIVGLLMQHELQPYLGSTEIDIRPLEQPSQLLPFAWFGSLKRFHPMKLSLSDSRPNRISELFVFHP